MKCASCGAEIKVGCIYCSVCGKEAQIVSDYNLLEDDFLRDVLREKQEQAAKEAKLIAEQAKLERKKTAGTSSQTQGGEKGKHTGSSNSPQSKGRKIKKRLIFAGASIVLLAVLIVAIIMLTNYSREHSYDYQMEQARKNQRETNYREAEAYVKRALELEPESLEAKFFLADIYLLRGAEPQAVSLLQEMCGEWKDNPKIYRRLIEIYEDQRDYPSIRTLSETTEDTEILELFSEYVPDTPEFDLPQGVYEEEISVGILSDAGCEVYYTLDGSKPEKGKKYQQPIPVEPGKTIKIRAVACSPYEFYSEEIEGEFQVELQNPEVPKVSPSGGCFYAPHEITVTVPEGCKVYYTWDSTDPTEDSQQYTQPIGMPEGNNILSLVLIDQYGMSSNVLRCNYIYMP